MRKGKRETERKKDKQRQIERERERERMLNCICSKIVATVSNSYS